MPRSGEDARRRLQQAALELYGEQGYERTSAAQIAERAGVNERTFFRHFADKREVLFDGEAALRIELERGASGAPQDAGPLKVLLAAFLAATPLLRENRSFSEPRQRLIASTPALHERALAKEASLVECLAGILVDRGAGEHEAHLAARVGMAAFSHAALRWLEGEHDVDDHLRRAFDDLRTLLGPE